MREGESCQYVTRCGVYDMDKPEDTAQAHKSQIIWEAQMGESRAGRRRRSRELLNALTKQVYADHDMRALFYERTGELPSQMSFRKVRKIVRVTLKQ